MRRPLPTNVFPQTYLQVDLSRRKVASATRLERWNASVCLSLRTTAVVFQCAAARHVLETPPKLQSTHDAPSSFSCT